MKLEIKSYRDDTGRLRDSVKIDGMELANHTKSLSISREAHSPLWSVQLELIILEAEIDIDVETDDPEFNLEVLKQLI